MESTTITVAIVAVWTGLAFAMWLAMTIVSTRAGLKRAPFVAALLSWLVACAAMSWLPMLLDWIITPSGA